LDRSTIKNEKLRRRETIDTAQARQYASHQQHQTPLKQLQAIFWPARHTDHTINNNQLKEHEQMPMITKNQTTTVQRSSSAREKNQNENVNERK
jgi:hypothetical protein